MKDTLRTERYSLLGVTWMLWVVGRSELGSARYEWRDASGRLRVGREQGGPRIWASVANKRLSATFNSIDDAMRAAMTAAQRARAA